VFYFVWTDNKESKIKDDFDRVIMIEQPAIGWPFDSMKRFHMFQSQQNMLRMMDYVFSFDADVVCKQTITGTFLHFNSLTCCREHGCGL
jgi:hypothetical protein